MMKRLTLKKVVLTNAKSVVVAAPNTIGEGCPVPVPTPTDFGCTYICY